MTAPTPTDPVDWDEERRRKTDDVAPSFVLTFDLGDLEELALKLPIEDDQNAALLEITRMKLERENAESGK